jgi:hypothetical protein
MGIILEETHGNAKWLRLWTIFRERFLAGDLSGAASADEGRMVVVGFEGSPCGAR